jgi:alpha-tubulin suppressor-like RCC1 family protein
MARHGYAQCINRDRMRREHTEFPLTAVISRVVALAALAATAATAATASTACGGGSDGAPAPGATPAGAGDPVMPGSPVGGGGGGGAVMPAARASLDCGGHGCSVKALALGTIAACALLEDGTVACYGGGIVGTLGRADRPMIDPVPTRVPDLKNVAKIYGGGYTMCAVLTDQTVTCWGPDQSENPYGARPSDRFLVEGLTGVVELSVATSHTCALVTGGAVYCLGSNYFGELGDGTTNNAKKAVKVASIAGARKVATGAEVTCAVLANGSASCWGMNDMGQLGQGNTDKLVHSDPMPVLGLDGPVKSIDASSEAGVVCALLESGTTKCWGDKLGDSEGAATPGATWLSVGWKHACVMDTAGVVSCFGSNTKGQLGNATLAPAPAAIAGAVWGVGGAIGFAVGGNSSCAVFGDGSFSCWGDDTRGQLGGGQIEPNRSTPEKQHL